MTLDTDLATWLAGQGLGTLASSLFVAEFPQTLDPATTATMVTLTGGRQSDWPREVLRPTVQVVTHGSYSAARDRAWAIHAALDGRDPTVMGSTDVQDVRALQAPFFIGRDQRGAARFSCNFQFWIGG